MSTEIKEILKLPVLKDARVIAGQSGINKKVKNVTVSEVPDASKWIKGGEMILTSGYFIKNDIELQKTWLKKIIHKGASALAINAKRFIGDMPKQLIDIAEENSFCLIELPVNATWSVIIEEVSKYLNEKQAKIIEKTERIHNNLTKIVLEDQGLEKIVKTISSLVDSTILVEDASLHILSLASPNKSKEDFKEFLNYRTSNEYKDYFLASNYYNNMLKKTNKKTHDNTFRLDMEKLNSKYHNFYQVTIPIIAGNVVFGFISMIKNYKEIISTNMIALQHGATTIALEMMKEKIKYETENSLKSEFFNLLLNGDFLNKEIPKKYSFIGYDNERPAIPIIFNIYNLENLEDLENKVKNNFSNNYIRDKIQGIIEKNIKELEPNGLITNEYSSFILLYPFNINENKKSVLLEIKNTCGKILENIKKIYPNIKYNVGIGEIYYDKKDLKKSYLEIRKVLDTSYSYIGENKIVQYGEMGIFKLLYLLNESELIQFCNELIGELIEYDKENSDNLCECLEEFLKNNCNITQAATELYIHPNTLSYRLKKISNILKVDIDDSMTRLNLYLGLIIKKFFMDK